MHSYYIKKKHPWLLMTSSEFMGGGGGYTKKWLEYLKDAVDKINLDIFSV